MNKKGFAVSGMIYAILVLFLVLVFGILSILGSRKLTFDKLKKEVLTNLNNNYISYNPNAPELYDNMVPVYYDEASSVWRKANISNINKQWYDYTNKKWANAVVVKNNINQTTATDKSKNGYHGVFENGTKISSEGAVFDGVDDAIRINETANIDLEDKFTLVARFKIDDVSNNSIVLGNIEAAGASIGVYSGKIFVQIYNTTTSKYSYIIQKENALPNTWYTVVLTYDGSKMKLYINGELDGSLDVVLDYKKTVTPFVLGRNPNSTGYDNREMFNGTISDALITKTVLSDDTISKYYGSEFIYQKNDSDIICYNFQNDYSVDNTIVYDDDIALWYVWIPRYKYTIFNGNNGSVSEQLINVTFESGTSKTGTVTCVDNVDGSETCNDAINGSIINGLSTYTHPAFTFGDTELTGLWVGKFEVSGSTSEITIKPNVSSLRSQTVSSFFTAIQNIKTTYGINNADSHMMKNMEWGAVAYLKQSKYGLGTADIAVNDNSSYYTGGGTNDAYKTNIAQSTTGNIYGVYDMSGGTWEYVMGNVKDSSNAFYSSGAGFTTAPATKYYDSYKYDTSNTNHARGKLGDATKETLVTFGNASGGWYSDYAVIPSSGYSWFVRGGNYVNRTIAGVFYFNYFDDNDGTARGDCSTRAVLSAQ